MCKFSDSLPTIGKKQEEYQNGKLYALQIIVFIIKKIH